MDYGKYAFDEMSPGPAPPPSVLGWDDTTPGGSGPHLLPGSPPLPSPASNAAAPHSGPPSRGFRGGDAGQQGAQGQGKGRGAAGRGKAAAAREGRAKDAPGAVVWAKLARYPWWPAQARATAHTQAAATHQSQSSLMEPDGSALRSDWDSGAVLMRGASLLAWSKSSLCVWLDAAACGVHAVCLLPVVSHCRARLHAYPLGSRGGCCPHKSAGASHGLAKTSNLHVTKATGTTGRLCSRRRPCPLQCEWWKGCGRGRRALLGRASISPEGVTAGALWARAGARGQVLALGDPFIPRHEEPPRRGAVPVRFFGTYDFAWIESQRALAPLAGAGDDHAAKCKTQARARPRGAGCAGRLQQSNCV